jgi:hypothetical protein
MLRVLIGYKPDEDSEVKGECNYYVYAHKDMEGNIFYIGKGKKRRAWDKDRHTIWEYYVDEYLNNEYEVEILKDNLSNEEALNLESKLIKNYGKNLVNWVNTTREVDMELYNKFKRLKDENEKYIKKIKEIEKEAPSKAADRYIKAFKKLKVYSEITYEKRNCLVLKLADEMEEMTVSNGNFHLIDRLSISLKRSKRYKELIKFVDDYFQEFPMHEKMKTAEKILKRKQFALNKLK